MGKKTLAHPEYQLVQDSWHPTLNLAKVPADFTHKSNRKVWLRCQGCLHGCGRQHEWEAKIFSLTDNEGHMVCPYCYCGSGGFCPCRSVESDPRLWKEWHSSNPPASQVATGSMKKHLWLCPEGHPPYNASCNSRCVRNTGCPACGIEKTRTTRHPLVSIGRPDLAKEWDVKRNLKLPSEVTLGSNFKVWWVCSSKSTLAGKLLLPVVHCKGMAAQHARTETDARPGTSVLLALRKHTSSRFAVLLPVC
jgi:hypothetical protein